MLRFPEAQLYKHFNFIKYGGVKSALLAAVNFRDYALRKLGRLEALEFEKRPDLTTTKSKACIGVFRSHTKQKNGRFYNWTARGGQNGKTHFSINKYGEEQAFILACHYRYEHCGTIIIVNKKLIPCNPDVSFRG